MKFSVEKQELLSGLTVAQSVIAPRTNLPVLSNVLINADGKEIKLVATDLDIGVKVIVPAKIDSSGGISINSKKLYDFIKEIDADEVEFVVKKNYHVHITAGSASARFYGLPEEEFPSLPSVKEKSRIEIPSDVLSNLVDLTMFAASRDSSRYELNGILFELEPNIIRTVASDGRKLSLVETDITHNLNHSFILPLKAGQELSRFLPESSVISISSDDSVVSFSWENVELISRIIEGEYPQYRQVIPKEKDEKALVDSSSFLSALKRASIFISTDSFAVRLDFYKNRLVISKDSQDVGSSREELSIVYPGEDITIGINPEFLIDMLKTVPIDMVKMEFVAPDRPIVIRDVLEIDGVGYRYMYLVSPMRI